MVEEKSLVDCEIVLNPKESGMYMDPLNSFTLSFFAGGVDRIKITKEMDDSSTFIRKSIRAMILFVYKNGKDVSRQYDGAAYKDVSRQPLVKSPLPVNPIDDKRYLDVLNRNTQESIIQDIRSIKDMPTLKRIMELEQKGNNPSSQSRAGVIDEIKIQMKAVSASLPFVAEELNAPKEEVAVK